MPSDGGNYDDTFSDGKTVGEHYLAKEILELLEKEEFERLKPD